MLLLGNEAIARGALEAGIGMVTTYPGTPASEISDSISAIALDAGLYMEYSINEIVAVEVAAGAANCGIRALTAMKHVGLNVAADLVMTLAYAGVRGGYVIVTADDPECDRRKVTCPRNDTLLTSICDQRRNFPTSGAAAAVSGLLWEH